MPPSSLLHLVAEAGEGQGGAGGAVAAGAPAVDDDGAGRVEEFRGAGGDLRGGQVDGAGDVALVPGLGAAGVDHGEAGIAGRGERGGHVGDVGVEGEGGGEVRGGLGGRRRGHPEHGVGGGVGRGAELR